MLENMTPGRLARSGLSGIAIVMGASAAWQAVAADELELAKHSGCLICHRGAENRIGPSFLDIAQKYAGKQGAELRLASHIVDGSGPAGVGWMQEGKARLPFMPGNRHVTQENASRLAGWVLGIRGEIVDPAAFRSERLGVSGLVVRPLELDVTDLRKLPQRRLDVAPTVDSGRTESFGGVLLRDVLDKAVVLSGSHFDFKKMVVIATASDDYKVVFSWSELFKFPVGDGVLVFFEKNGRLLDDGEGRIALLSAKDAGVGSRYVKWLTAIEVRRIVD